MWMLGYLCARSCTCGTDVSPGWLRVSRGEGMGSGGTGGGCPSHRSGMGDLAGEGQAVGLFKVFRVVH